MSICMYTTHASLQVCIYTCTTHKSFFPVFLLELVQQAEVVYTKCACVCILEEFHSTYHNIQELPE